MSHHAKDHPEQPGSDTGMAGSATTPDIAADAASSVGPPETTTHKHTGHDPLAGEMPPVGLAALSAAATNEGTTSPITWLKTPADHDYAAAINYLSLVVDPLTAARIVDQFAGVGESYFKAKDIMRASRLALLPDDDPSVSRELAKIAAKEALSPILLIRGNFQDSRDTVIADGYHRACASYHLDEDQTVPVRIVDA